MRQQNVVILQVFFKYDNDLCVRELMSIRTAIGRAFRPAMHDKRHMAFVIQTTETPEELVNRIRNVLEADSIANYWALIPYQNPAGKFGGLDALTTRVRMAYADVRNKAKAKDMRKAERLVRESSDHDTLGKVHVERRGKRKHTQRSDRA
ncbi:hypothetical protein [Euryhalocaulis caribicus]|uniref:hypothetical protein n=1 Tax=Euryhalocaulis caribicus TaxID=1161401 RepID=UPI0003B32466|nr:hypothetical protein [Euryhalocaulis caribicus]